MRDAISVVIPTLSRLPLLRRVLDRLDAQTAPRGSFEVIVAADAKESAVDEIDRALAEHSLEGRRVSAATPGASSARNAGWRAASGAIVLFIDDDILPDASLLAEHAAWHARHPEEEVGVLGHVRWADDLDVTPFMRWLEQQSSSSARIQSPLAAAKPMFHPLTPTFVSWVRT